MKVCEVLSVRASETLGKQMSTWVNTHPLRMASLASLQLAGGFQIHLKHKVLKCSLPVAPLVADLPSQPFCILHNILLNSNFLLYHCRWIKFSQCTDWKFWHCFRLWYFMSHIPGWKVLDFYVLCNTTPFSLNAQDYQMRTKYKKGFSYTNIVNKEVNTCSKHAFIALCFYRTMVIYSSMDSVILSDHVLIWEHVY